MDNKSENSGKLLQQLASLLSSLLSSTKTIKIGSAKRNNGQTNTGIVLGDMIEGISEEALSGWFAELRKQIQIDNERAVEKVTNAIDSVLVSKMAKIVAEAYHTHCLSICSEKEKFKLTLRDIQDKAGSITAEIQTVIQECQGTREKVDELVKRLSALNENIKAELGNILGLCKDILFEIRFFNERIDKLFELVQINTNTIEKLNGNVLSYIQLAEKNHEESRLILASQEKKDERLSPAGLDEKTILAMHVWVDKIARDISEKHISEDKIIESIQNQENYLKHKLTEVQGSLDDIRRLIDQYGTVNGEELKAIKYALSQKAEKILKREAELYSLVLDTKQSMDEALKLLAKLENLTENLTKSMFTQLQNIGENLNGSETHNKQELNNMLETLQQYKEAMKSMEHQLLIAKQKDEAFKEECPYCGYVEWRGVVGDMCQCDCCGKTFNRKNEDKAKVAAWRAKHTAILENVGSSKTHNNLCRMSLKDREVSSKGILIIPSEANKCGPPLATDHDQITIAFCQPNIDDEVGQEKLRRVKTLILPEKFVLTDFNDAFPFSEIDGLEKVLRFDKENKKCTEDVETLRQIKEKKTPSRRIYNE